MIKKKKGNILFYFEIIIAFGMLLFSVLSIRGTTSKDVSFTDIKRTFEDYETMKGLRIGGKDDAERRYGISFSERGNCYIRYSEVLLNVTEFAIIYEPNQDTRYIQEDKLNEYLQELKNKFNNYGISQNDLLKHAIIETRGDYIIFCISKDAKAWEEAVLSVVG